MIRIFKAVFFLSILLSLALFIVHTDLQHVWVSISDMSWNFIWLLLLTFLAYAIGTLGWYYCLGEEKKKISLSKLFFIRLISESVSLVNPTSIIGGDYLKILLLKPSGAAEKTVVNSVLISRALMVVTQLFLFISAVSILYFGSNKADIRQKLRMVTLSMLALFAGIVAITALLMLVRREINKQKLPPLLSRIFQKAKLLAQGLKLSYQQDKKGIAKAFFHFCLHWFIGAMEFYFILHFLHIPIAMIESLFMDMGVIFFKSAGAFIPAQLGIEEYGNKVMLLMIGITAPGVWLSVSLLRRARQLFWMALGLLCYLFVFRKNFQLSSAV